MTRFHWYRIEYHLILIFSNLELDIHLLDNLQLSTLMEPLQMVRMAVLRGRQSQLWDQSLAYNISITTQIKNHRTNFPPHLTPCMGKIFPLIVLFQSDTAQIPSNYKKHFRMFNLGGFTTIIIFSSINLLFDFILDVIREKASLCESDTLLSCDNNLCIYDTKYVKH